ncbi:cation efflux system protein [Alphaproteobacteria bacterium]|nr:cation efflux system protein [Alphaproteobacteria bacterium]
MHKKQTDSHGAHLCEHDRYCGAVKTTLLGLAANLVLFAAQFAAGLFGASAAMVADSMHTLSDSLTDVVVIVCARLSHAPPDESHPYGHGRYETVGSLILGAILLVVALAIAAGAARTVAGLLHGIRPPPPSLWLACLAGATVVAKETMYRYTMAQAKTLKYDALIANAWHHRSDAMSSVAVLFGIAGAACLGESFVILDPIAAIVVSLMILRVAFGILGDGIHALLDGAIDKRKREEILEIARMTPGALVPHKLRTRTVGALTAVELHVCMPPETTLAEADAIVGKITRKIKGLLGESSLVSIYPEPLAEG